MKRISVFLVILSVLTAFSVNGQSPAKSPLDPVITKFNNGANKVNTGDYAGAIADMQEVITLADGVGASANDLKSKAKEQIPILHYQVALNNMKQKNYEDAVTALEKSIQTADEFQNNQPTKEKALKNLIAIHNLLGKQKFSQKQLDAALSNFQSVVKYSPSDATAYLGMGFIYAEKADEEKMVANLQKAIELAKASSDMNTVTQAQQRLGRFYINIGNTDLADVDKDNPDYSYAIKDFEKAISYDPKATDAYYTLSMIYNKTMEFDKVIANATKALETEKVDVNIAAINYELGLAYFNTAEYSKACEAFKKAMVGPIAEKAQARKEKVPGCN